jgi:hypothetical protein
MAPYAGVVAPNRFGASRRDAGEPSMRGPQGRNNLPPAAGIADDIRVDEDGNLWCAGGWGPDKNFNGVSVFAPDGTPIGRVALLEAAARWLQAQPEPPLHLCEDLPLRRLRRNVQRRSAENVRLNRRRDERSQPHPAGVST